MNVHVIIGKMVRKKRIARGMTQSDLASKLGHQTPQFVSFIERGLSKVPHETLGKLRGIIDLDTKKVINLLLADYKLKLQKEINK